VAYSELTDVKNFQIPYVVSGNGGYLKLSPTRLGKNEADPQPGVPGTDGKGNALTLDVYNNTTFGFLRLTVSASSILLESLGVDETSGQVSTIDNFTVDLLKHVVHGAAPESKIKAGVAVAHEYDRTVKKKKR